MTRHSNRRADSDPELVEDGPDIDSDVDPEQLIA